METSFEFNGIITKAGEEQNGRIPITIIPSRPTFDRVKDKIILDAFDDECKRSFLYDGVIDWDHKSMLGKDELEKAQAIIGQPEDLRVQDGIPICEAFLFKGNPFVDNVIIPALKAKSKILGASIGGKVIRKSTETDPKGKKIGNILNKIKISHIAITPLQKAVHQGTSVSFRKSNDQEEIFIGDFETLVKSLTDESIINKALEAGSETDVSKISGGQALQTQSLEGNNNRKKKKKNVSIDKIKSVMPFVLDHIAKGNMNGGYKELKQYLTLKGLNDDESDELSKLIAKNGSKIVKLIF